MNIVLVGFMCSGKSRVGKELSKKLGWPHVDTDDMIVKDVGASISDIIRKQGEPAFRAIEQKAVQLVSLLDANVISTGGGVPMDPVNMKALQQSGPLVWLKVSPETVLKRAGNLKSRPLIDPADPIGSIRKRMAEREKFYSQATVSIEADDLAYEAVADKIISLVPGLAA